jgi:SulP family sulfate permease
MPLLTVQKQIEVVPFFHKMAFTIMAQVGEDNPKAVLATTVLSYSMSSVLTGLVFFLMGQCKLGALIGFFPRHILIGCIGGVGFFLVATGVEVSARLDGNLEYNMATLKKLFEDDTIALWTIPLGLAVSLLVLKKWIKHSLLDAAWFVSIIMVFYIVVAAIPSLDVADLRSKGWVFEAPAAGAPWFHFYSLYGMSSSQNPDLQGADKSRFWCRGLEGSRFHYPCNACVDFVCAIAQSVGVLHLQED